MSIKSAIESLAAKEAHNPVVLRTVHTVWEAALGAGVAAISGAHGDIRDVIAVAVAGGLAALKTAIVAAVEGRSVPAVAVEAPVPTETVVRAPEPQPVDADGNPILPPAVVPVDVVETPSTPASLADPGAVPPAAQ